MVSSTQRGKNSPSKLDKNVYFCSRSLDIKTFVYSSGTAKHRITMFYICPEVCHFRNNCPGIFMYRNIKDRFKRNLGDHWNLSLCIQAGWAIPNSSLITCYKYKPNNYELYSLNHTKLFFICGAGVQSHYGPLSNVSIA